MRKSILNRISLCRVKIRYREAFERELEDLMRSRYRSETLQEVMQRNEHALEIDRDELQRVLAVIEAHPDELQRDVLKSIWVDGLTFEAAADLLGYSEGYLRHQHAKALRLINQQYPQERGEGGGPIPAEQEAESALISADHAACVPLFPCGSAPE